MTLPNLSYKRSKNQNAVTQLSVEPQKLIIMPVYLPMELSTIVKFQIWQESWTTFEKKKLQLSFKIVIWQLILKDYKSTKLKPRRAIIKKY